MLSTKGYPEQKLHLFLFSPKIGDSSVSSGEYGLLTNWDYAETKVHCVTTANKQLKDVKDLKHRKTEIMNFVPNLSFTAFSNLYYLCKQLFQDFLCY